MFSDPQTITINSVPNTCNRVLTEGSKAIYQTSDGNIRLTISHQEGKDGRMRRMARVDKRVVAADPLTAENDYESLGVYVVVDEPSYGFADADIKYVQAGLFALINSAFMDKLLGSEI